MEALLPVGFYDFLAPKTHHQREVLQRLIAHSISYGYQLVEPPLVEFEDTFKNSAGDDVASLAFRVVDPQSRKMMAIRSDMTPQVSRIAASRLADEPLPLRLTYAGKVLRVVSDHFHAERELTQAGVELIGATSPLADVEVLTITIKALQAIGLTGLSIDFNLPNLPQQLLQDVAPQQRQEIINAIVKKDIAKVSALLPQAQSEIIRTLLDPAITLDGLKQIELSTSIQQDVAHLEAVVVAVQKTVSDIKITLDPLGSQQFGYHTHLGFSVFSKQAKGELARGGRYAMPSKENSTITATGISFYINEIFRYAVTQAAPGRVYVPLDEASHLEVLQAEDFITVCAIEPAENVENEAARLGCGFICRDGQAVAL